MSKNEQVNLTELAARAKALNERASKNEKATLELGKLLLKVQGLIKYSLKRWIESNIGKSKSTLNRCKYALSLADPNSKRNRRKEPTSAVIYNAVKEIRQAVSKFAEAVEDGDTGEVEELRATVIKALDKLVKRAEYMMVKKGRKLHLDKLAASDNPEKKAIGQTALAEEFSNRTLSKEDTGYDLGPDVAYLDREVHTSAAEKTSAATVGKS